MLLLDAGNSRLKWALARNGAWLQRGMLDLAKLGSLRQVFSALPPPHRILASNVAGARAAEQLRAACALWPCPVEFVTAQREQCGVRNGYAQPAQLGSDRWAALIAAWRRVNGACVVVNCGTATTVDALSCEGEFLGGLILPGLEMMRRSLAAGTAQLKESVGQWSAFPRNTADAVYSGAIQATAGAVSRQHELLQAPDAPCVLGGGAADEIEPRLPHPVIRMDDMVLQGLQLIGLEAEE